MITFEDFERDGLIEHGHTVFASGNHADVKVNYEKVSDELNEAVIDELAKKIDNDLQPCGALVGVASGGNMLVSPLASKLSWPDLRLIETVKRDGRVLLPKDALRILGGITDAVIIEDVVNHATTTRRVGHMLMQIGVEPRAIATPLNRNVHSTVKIRGLQVPIISVVKNIMPDWKPEECPYDH
jgi:orotate phosphoribosyltransferase